MYYWGRLSVVVHEAAAASGLPESNSQPSRAGACSCCVCSDTQGQQGCCYQLLSLARHGRAHAGCCWQVAINLANQQLSEEGSVLLLQGIRFLLQVDWYSCTSIFQHSSAKSVRSGWSRRDFSSAKARQNCSAGAGTSLQIWTGLGAAGMLNNTWGNTGDQNLQGKTSSELKCQRENKDLRWDLVDPRSLAALCCQLVPWAWL